MDRGETMPGRLAGKVALISGTAGGQGRRAAMHFAAEGAKVVGCDVKVAEAEETVEMVRAAGGEMVSFQPVDLTDEDCGRGLDHSAVEAYGDFDILYNNAAVAKAAEPRRRHACRLGLEHGQRGHAGVPRGEARAAGVRTARRRRHHQRRLDRRAWSGSGMPGNAAGNLVHCVAKAAVIRLTENLAIELASRNIRVNSISPGRDRHAAAPAVPR